MRFLKRVFDFYVNASIHMAFGAVALVFITQLEFHLSNTISVLLFIFFATLVGYNFVKYFGLEKSQQINSIEGVGFIRVFTIFCSVPMFYFLFELNKASWLYLVALGLITFFYGIPFFHQRISLRAIRGIKAYVVALVWCIATVVVPVVSVDSVISHDVVVTTVQRFLIVFILMFPFEIRDMKYDNTELATIPQVIGVRNTKILGLLLVLSFFLIEFLKDELKTNWVVVNLLLCVAISLVILLSKEDQGKYYSAFWVDGILLFWLGLLLLIQEFFVERVL